MFNTAQIASITKSAILGVFPYVIIKNYFGLNMKMKISNIVLIQGDFLYIILIQCGSRMIPLNLILISLILFVIANSPMF